MAASKKPRPPLGGAGPVKKRVKKGYVDAPYDGGRGGGPKPPAPKPGETIVVAKRKAPKRK